LQLDIGKAMSLLAWKPKLRIEQALDWLIDWYRRYYAGYRDMRGVTLKQIEEYSAMTPALDGPIA
jgi:CDP-glucose 4,6-dehydratase